MNSDKSKTFFKKLKDTCRRIDRDIAEIKRTQYELPSDDGWEKIVEMSDKVKNLKSEAEALKNDIVPKFAHTRAFLNDFEDIVLEAEDFVSKEEKHLQKYGYEPLSVLETAPALVSLDDHATPEKDSNKLEAKNNHEKTPTIFDFGMVASNYRSGCDSSEPSDRKSSVENFIIPEEVLSCDTQNEEKLESTPVLDVNATPDKNEEMPAVYGSSMLKNSTNNPPTPTLDLLPFTRIR